jgi:hypothetical protein
MTTTTTDDRTETKRFAGDATPFDATDLIVGDCVDPSLVARTMDGLGATMSARPDAQETQLAEATITDRYDDVHTAILVDGETGRMVVASRHDRQQAMSQKEADWKVRAVGRKIAVPDAEVAQDGNDEWDEESAADGAEAWANVVLQDRARGATDYEDELTLGSRSSMTLYEPYGATKVYADIELVPGNDDAD